MHHTLDALAAGCEKILAHLFQLVSGMGAKQSRALEGADPTLAHKGAGLIYGPIRTSECLAAA